MASSIENEPDAPGEDGLQPMAQESKEEEILVERSIINETMIRRAVYTEMLERYEANVIPAEQDLDLTAISTLCLSFKNIYHIDNLVGFEQLTKLQLDNNIIRKIEHLDHLVNLKWLDLSFNNITKIEGLDNLTQLEDLSLFDNKIERIEGLDSLVNTLNVLSLGNNNIRDLSSIEDLRPFKKLRLLNLTGNPICKMEEYKTTVLAYLGSNKLKYLDYTLIEEAAAIKARNSKIELISAWEEEESKQQEKAKDMEKEAEWEQRLVEANLGGLNTLIDTVLQDDVKEQQKVQKLPDYGKILQEFRMDFESKTTAFIEAALKRSDEMFQEHKLFQEALRIYEVTEEKCRTLIRGVASRKKRAFRHYDALWKELQKEKLDRYTDGHREMLLSPLEELKVDVTELRDNLMDIEMLLVEQNAGLIKEFTDVYQQMAMTNEHETGSFFQALNDIENDYLKNLNGLATQLIDRVQKDEQVTEDADAEFFLKDKDQVMAVVMQSHENHSNTILAKDDEVRLRMSTAKKSLLRNINKGEMERNRHRVSEIYDLYERYMQRIEEKANEHVEELERDYGYDNY